MDDLKEALCKKTAVLFTANDGSEYEMTVTGIIYRSRGDGVIVVTAELLDKSGRSITYALPKQLRSKA